MSPAARRLATVASSLAASRLTEAHRQTQSQNVAVLYLLLVQRWKDVRANDLDASFRGWLAYALPQIERYRRGSAQLAGRYYTAFRSIEMGSLQRPTLKLVETIERVKVETSLRVTGVVSFKKRMRTIVADEPTIERSLRISGNMAASAAIRHALDGGRETLAETVKADRLALGWARVTRGRPCYFCAMLASRGPAYKAASFAASDPRFEGGEGNARVHDSCNCSLEPVFKTDADWPGKAREWEQLWKDSTRGESDKINAFRRAYERRR